MSEADKKRMYNAKDMSDAEIDSVINDIISETSKGCTITEMTGQDVWKLTGRLAKKYGAKNAQKILGRLCNSAVKTASAGVKLAGKKIPGINLISGGYGIYKAANGDNSGLYDAADAIVGLIPYVGPAISLIGTENIHNAIKEDVKNADGIRRLDALAMSL